MHLVAGPHWAEEGTKRQAVFSHRQEFQGNPTIMHLKKIHWQIAPALRLTRAHLLIWLTLSLLLRYQEI